MAYAVIGIDDEMPFGKFRGEPVAWIIDNHPDYLGWLLEQDNPPDFTDEVLEALMAAGY